MVRIIFKDKQSYKHIDDVEKERMQFMFNSIISRGLPVQANLLNKKGIDKACVMDIWFTYSKSSTKIPDWFIPNWGKLKSNKSDNVLNNYSDTDKYLLSFYPDAIKEEKERIELDKKSNIDVIKKKKGA